MARPDYDHYRAELRALTDDELLTRCTVLKRLERGSLRRGDFCPSLTQAWYECCRRERVDVFEAALAAVRAEEQAHRAANAAAWKQLAG